MEKRPMPETDKKDANDAIMRAVAALGAISIDVIKHADDERIEEFVAALRDCHEIFEPDMDSWIENYQRRKQEEM
jgi:hypothetical protein